MSYRWSTWCPRCNEYGEAVSLTMDRPNLNCGECLMRHQIIIPLEEVLVAEVISRSERPKTSARAPSPGWPSAT
jgi:hypothetical protein